MKLVELNKNDRQAIERPRTKTLGFVERLRHETSRFRFGDSLQFVISSYTTNYAIWHEAARSGDVNEIKSFLRREFSQVDHRGPDGSTALLESSRFGHVDIVVILLHEGADINLQDWLGESALMKAVQGRHVRLVSALVLADADINARDYRGMTSLMKAVCIHHIPIIKILLDHHVDVSVEDKLGRTARDWAASRGLDDLAVLLAEGR